MSNVKLNRKRKVYSLQAMATAYAYGFTHSVHKPYTERDRPRALLLDARAPPIAHCPAASTASRLVPPRPPHTPTRHTQRRNATIGTLSTVTRTAVTLAPKTADSDFSTDTVDAVTLDL